MANLIVRNIDEAIVKALEMQASQHGISVEAEHRKILEQVLLKPQKKPFAQVLSEIPNVGKDIDFERTQDDESAMYLIDTNVISEPKLTGKFKVLRGIATENLSTDQIMSLTRETP